MAHYNRAPGGGYLTSDTYNKRYGASEGITSGSNAVLEALQNAVNKNFTAAATANDISKESQKTAMDFNSAMANIANSYNSAYLASQQAFNTDAAAQANAINQSMWQQTADYNSAEAAKNREWQEMMSSTAYQRAVKDLRAAGLNPILAALNGGASMGAGATGASGALQATAATSGLQSAQSASVGSYTGILENTSNTLALAAAMIEGFTGIADAIKGDKTGTTGNVLDYILDPDKNSNAYVADEFKKWIDDIGYSGAKAFKDWITKLRNPQGGGGHSRGGNGGGANR